MSNQVVNKEMTREDKKMLREMFWYSFFLEHSYNYERQQALGYAVSMWPAIRRYHTTQEARSEALVRHMQIFNTSPNIVTTITGVNAALEKEASENKDFDTTTINSIKVSLMGPVAGIGDSFFWGTFRIIATAIALPLSAEGSVLGPILFLIAFNVPHILARWYGGIFGFRLGTNILSDVGETGLIAKITKGATIVGLMVIGGMSAKMVHLSTTVQFSLGDSVFLLQDYINQIFPLLLPLLYVLLMFWLLSKKKQSATSLLLVSVAVGILGVFFNIL